MRFTMIYLYKSRLILVRQVICILLTRKVTTITIEEHAFSYEVDFSETIISVSIQFERLRI